MIKGMKNIFILKINNLSSILLILSIFISILTSNFLQPYITRLDRAVQIWTVLYFISHTKENTMFHNLKHYRVYTLSNAIVKTLCYKPNGDVL